METVDELLEEYSIQQINQMVKLNNRGYDVSYLPPKVLTVEKLRLFLSFIDKYNHEQKCLIKYGIEHGYNIFLYNNNFFSPKQMEMIIMGIEDGIDVTLYANTKFNLAQMREIKNLLTYNKVNKTNLDVTRIAKVRYDYNQMYQLKLGMVNGVDISYYENPDFNSDQMQIIRLGLESNLDVSKYANPKISAEEMTKILHELKYKRKFLNKLFVKK